MGPKGCALLVMVFNDGLTIAQMHAIAVTGR